MQSRDVNSPMHCLTSLKMWHSCDVIQAPSGQPAFAYFFFSTQPYSISFGSEKHYALRGPLREMWLYKKCRFDHHEKVTLAVIPLNN